MLACAAMAHVARAPTLSHEMVPLESAAASVSLIFGITFFASS
jgi:hypothetical protein